MAYTLAPIITNQINEEIQYIKLLSEIKLPGIKASINGDIGTQIIIHQRVHPGTNLPFGKIQKSATVGAVNKNAINKSATGEISNLDNTRTSNGPGITIAKNRR